MGKKTFYTERDIEEMAARGTTRLTVNDDVVLTDVAREKAEKLGISLVDSVNEPVLPHAVYRAPSYQGYSRKLKDLTPPRPADDLTARIKAAVIAKLGSDAPEELLDIIIPQVLAKLQK